MRNKCRFIPPHGNHAELVRAGRVLLEDVVSKISAIGAALGGLNRQQHLGFFLSRRGTSTWVTMYNIPAVLSRRCGLMAKV